MRFVLLGTIGVLAALNVVGCSNTPSEDQAREAVNSNIRGESKGVITLASFRKTNGVKAELMGVPIYSIEFEGEIMFNQDCQWGDKFSGGFETYTGNPKSGSYEEFERKMFAGQRHTAKAGERKTIRGSVTFSGSEKGWVVERISAR